MALQITSVKRKFKFEKTGGKSIVLDDPNPEFTPEEVMTFYTNAHPELTTATISGPIISANAAEYEFKKTVGTKG